MVSPHYSNQNRFTCEIPMFFFNEDYYHGILKGIENI